ncbi:hypothetical protein LSAT2_011180 [Lamellibrachia satsuma]|nr:hypothetical protein LSAT2_011180 [Lamellibrachia satsuma]
MAYPSFREQFHAQETCTNVIQRLVVGGVHQTYQPLRRHIHAQETNRDMVLHLVTYVYMVMFTRRISPIGDTFTHRKLAVTGRRTWCRTYKYGFSQRCSVERYSIQRRSPSGMNEPIHPDKPAAAGAAAATTTTITVAAAAATTITVAAAVAAATTSTAGTTTTTNTAAATTTDIVGPVSHVDGVQCRGLIVTPLAETTSERWWLRMQDRRGMLNVAQ